MTDKNEEIESVIKEKLLIAAHQNLSPEETAALKSQVDTLRALNQ
jgi:hypothetical protein